MLWPRSAMWGTAVARKLALPASASAAAAAAAAANLRPPSRREELRTIGGERKLAKHLVQHFLFALGGLELLDFVFDARVGFHDLVAVSLAIKSWRARLEAAAIVVTANNDLEVQPLGIKVETTLRASFGPVVPASVLLMMTSPMMNTHTHDIRHARAHTHAHILPFDLVFWLTDGAHGADVQR